MRDINIQVKENHTVDFENDYAGLNRENLQGNIIFNFDKFVSGQARVEIVINNVSGYINLDQVEQTYILPIKSSLLTGNDILMQLVIDEPATYKLTTDTDIDTKKIYYEKVGDNYVQVEHPRKADLGNYYEASIPVWKSETFYLKVGFSINAEETIPEQYPSWIETLNNLINETESAIEQASNVNISATQTQSGATITITNKDGESNSVNITNGADGTDGKDAKINGYNTITIQEGTNIGIEQNGEILTINNTYDDTSIKNDITTLQNTKANKSELSVYSLITETGSKIDLEINSSTYVLTAKLYDKNNVLLSTSTGIDLPLETMVVGASYDSETKEIILTLKNGQEVRFSVADLVSGLQTEITSDNKLASDLVDDTNQTHKFVSASEKTQITTNATNITSLQNNKEDKSNKVTSISSSSTDTQYPSAKCMYDSQTLQDNEISDLKSENDYLNSIINQLPKVSSQGTILTLNNTIAGRMNIELGTSELEQDGTPTPDTPYPIHTISGNNKVVVEGKNLFDDANAENILISATGSISSNVNWRTCGYVSINPNTAITMGTQQLTSGYFQLKIVEYDKNKNFIQRIDGDNVLTKSITTSANCYYVRTAYRSDLQNKPQLEKGSTATPYTPYVSQEANINLGNLEYCEIGDYKDEFVRSDGSNLFDISTLEIGKAWNNGSNSARAVVFVNCKPNTSYSISASGISGFDDSKIIVFEKENVASTSQIANHNVTTSTTITTSATTNCLAIQFNKTGISLSDFTNAKIMLNEGSTTLPYQPYGIGNWGIRKNIGKVVLDGTETIATESTVAGKTRFRIGGISNVYKNSSSSDASTIKCDKLISGSIVDTYNDIQCISFGLSSSDYYKDFVVYITNTGTMSTADFITWLGTNNLTVYYRLATPTYTQITGTLAEQLENIYQYLLSYKGTTNISQINNDLPFNISASALLDLNTLVGE